MKRLCLLSALFFVVTTQSAQAEIAAAYSLEWLADHCIDSGIYRVTAVAKEKKLTACYKVAFAVQETLRGKPAESAEGRYQRYPPPVPEDLPIVEVGDEFLICFQHYSNGDKRAVQLINITKPQAAGAQHIAVTSDARILQDGKTIVEVFRDRLKQRPKAHAVAAGDRSQDNLQELKFGTDLYEVLYSGSRCYLIVPADLVPKQK